VYPYLLAKAICFPLPRIKYGAGSNPSHQGRGILSDDR
jgi:hypothetical protein